MTTYFVSRHPGALQWMQAHGPAFDRHLLHLEEADLARLAPGDQGGNVHGDSGIYSGFCGKDTCGACARARGSRREHGYTKISEVTQKDH